MPEYRELREEEISTGLFRHFIRRQEVGKCWRRENGEWKIKDAPFVDDWTPEDYKTLVRCLRRTCSSGGCVCAAFCEGELKGFVSVERGLFGGDNRYFDLSSLHVSQELRGHGIGTRLLQKARAWAREQGAKKLYISAHSAVESQAFYRAMGCVEAQMYHPVHVAQEPFDCQLELSCE